MDIELLRKEGSLLPWFHRIDLGNGVITPGQDIDGQAKIEFNKIPTDLRGKTVLDIGAWDGLFSFEAERRGAARVLATDSFCWNGQGWGSKACFELARKALQSRVEDMDIDVMEISPERVGLFDVVFLLGVLYHLRHPLLALEKVSSVTKEMLILSTWVDMVNLDRPAAAFYPKAELGNDPTNWWGFNLTCIQAMLEDVGFKRVEAVSTMTNQPTAPVHRPFPMAFHAWK
jgi:tRNA (mo5U34)-methyltransferase